MPKDRRNTKHAHAKRVSKQQFLRRVGLLGAFLLVVVIVLIVLLTRGCASQDSGQTMATTTSTSTVMTALTTTTATAVTTTAVSDETSAPTEETDANEEPTAAQTAATVASSEGHYVQSSGADWNLRLVNAWNTMTQQQSDELPITYFENGEYCDSRIADALSAMLEDGAEYGLYVTSGYRSYSLQEELFENKIGRVQAAYGCGYDEAAVIAATEVARPGTSEHNTGLAVDLLNNQCYELEEYWEDTDAFTWLMAHCADYGFILRFPKNGESSTGVIYEPWHYRYVGVTAAQEIMSRGITLEQYLEERGL